MLMKKMKYEKPSMKVVVLSNQSHLLAGSENASAGFRGFESDAWYDFELEEGGEL